MEALGKNKVFPDPNLDAQSQWTLNESHNELEEERYLEAEGLCDKGNSHTGPEISAEYCEVDIFLGEYPPRKE